MCSVVHYGTPHGTPPWHPPWAPLCGEGRLRRRALARLERRCERPRPVREVAWPPLRLASEAGAGRWSPLTPSLRQQAPAAEAEAEVKEGKVKESKAQAAKEEKGGGKGGPAAKGAEAQGTAEGVEKKAAKPKPKGKKNKKEEGKTK